MFFRALSALPTGLSGHRTETSFEVGAAGFAMTQTSEGHGPANRGESEKKGPGPATDLAAGLYPGFPAQVVGLGAVTPVGEFSFLLPFCPHPYSSSFFYFVLSLTDPKKG